MEVQIQRETYAKIMHWINKSSDEVSGFGKATYHAETGVFEIHDAYLLKQSNGSAHTDIDAASLGRLMFLTKDTPGELRWWWHSHVRMACFWSGTDTATIKELGGQGWILATVFNQLEEMRSAVGYLSQRTSKLFGNAPQEETIIEDELDTYIMDHQTPELVASWDEEYDKNVTKTTYLHSGGKGKGWKEREPDPKWNTEDYRQPSLMTHTSDDPVTRGQPRQAGMVEGRQLVTLEEHKQNIQWWMDYGWLGYGAKVEAASIGMDVRSYISILESNDKTAIELLEQRLELAEAQGFLPKEKASDR